MADRYQQFVDSPPGRFMVRRLGLPQPAPLQRGPALLDGPILLGGAISTRDLLTRIGFEIRHDAERYAAVIFDASRITRTGELREVYDFFHDAIRQLAPSGRLIVIGSGEGVAQRALEGFVRSAAKEVRAGATAQLVHAEPEAELESTLRFLLSGRSAYVSGQVIRVGAAVPDAPADWRAAAGRQDRRRHRRLARHRRGHRRGAGARRRARRLRRRPGPGRGPRGGRQRGRRLGAPARRHDPIARPASSPSAAPTSWSTTPASRATGRSPA